MSLIQRYANEVSDFLKVCALLSQKMYVTSHGGNLSYRLEDDLLLITPTRVPKGSLTEKDLVFIDLKGRTREGSREPTGETPMYLNFYRDRPDAKSVIHCHPPSTNAFAVLKGTNWLMRPVFPETVVEVGPVPIVPYAEPLTQELADNFVPLLRRYNAFLMANHGLVILSPEGIVRTLDLVDILELTAISILQALAVGAINELTREDVRKLENTRRTRKLPAIGAPGVVTSIEDLYFPAGKRRSKN
jgi:L-fuculose-phosphate aldolase